MISLYIHIPFCEVKCGYCDFFSIPRGWEDFDLQKEYTEALIREIDTRVGAIRESPLQSIFFGGGTPSLLAPVLLEKIFSALQRHFIWDNRIEITLETNPKTVSLEKLKDFRSLGINRLSVGVQSFQDKFLKVLGRIHSGDEAIKTLSDARKAGFENVSLDLIYALPGQSLKEWKEDLEEALKLETNHLSAYHLTIEKGTPFEKLYGRGDSRIAPTRRGPGASGGASRRRSPRGGCWGTPGCPPASRAPGTPPTAPSPGRPAAASASRPPACRRRSAPPPTPRWRARGRSGGRTRRRSAASRRS